MSANPLRNLPSVSDLLESSRLRPLIDRVSHSVVAGHIRQFLDELRDEIRKAADEFSPLSASDMAERISNRILSGERPSLRPVINASGILLHTGLGRAPLAPQAVEAICHVAQDYASVELDLATGQRSQRVWAVETLLKQLTGAEAAVVVNNNAGATMLALAALGQGREVIVSRGQLVEIGGSFRLPDVMQTSGAVLREVGTTNKTKIADYREAISERTAALMRVHPSNYAVLGFTAEASLAELVALGKETGLPVIDDIGSGAMLDFVRYGFHNEPSAADSIAQGADVVLFSGDKLLGGPQCGIALGSKKTIAHLAKHPMMRALRVDKLTLAALAATLQLYRHPEQAEQSIPLLSLLSVPVEQLQQRAQSLASELAAIEGIAEVRAVEDVAYLGGGSIPTQQMKTWCVSLLPKNISIDSLAKALRGGRPAVVGRIQQDRLLLDLRAVFSRHDKSLLDAVRAAAATVELKP